MAYEEQLLDRRYWKELQNAGAKVASLQDACHNIAAAKERAEAELAKVKEEAGRLAHEAEDKAKAAVAAESARLQVEFDQRLEVALGEAKKRTSSPTVGTGVELWSRPPPIWKVVRISSGRSRKPSLGKTGVNCRYPR